MAKKMKDYQIFKCPYCSCEFYDRTARDGKKIGNPMMECPQCKKDIYISSVLEPALIGGNRFFDVKFSSLYGNIRIAMILLYALFMFVILVTRDFTLAMCFIVVAAILFALYCIVRAQHRKNYLQSDEYNKEIEHSLERLEDPDYAAMIAGLQGIDENSVYFYELHQTN